MGESEPIALALQDCWAILWEASRTAAVWNFAAIADGVSSPRGLADPPKVKTEPSCTCDLRHQFRDNDDVSETTTPTAKRTLRQLAFAAFVHEESVVEQLNFGVIMLVDTIQ